MAQEESIRPVREARRIAALAREIVADHTGPWQALRAATQKHPEAALLTAFALGVAVAHLLRRG